MLAQPWVSIIILNYNGLSDTKECVRSLLKTKYKNFHVFIVDNGSENNEADLLEESIKDKHITVIRNNTNYGFAEGNNRIIRTLRSPYVVLLNNDTKVTPLWLSYLIKTIQKDKNIAACQPKIMSLTQKGYFDYAGAAGGYLDGLGYPYARGRIGFHMEKDEGQYDTQADIFWASGACILFRTDALKKVGILAKEYFFYHEETDLCWRLKNKGYRIVSNPTAIVYHKGAATSSRNMPQRIFYVHRNNLLLVTRNMSLSRLMYVLPLRFVLDFASGIFYILTNNPEYFVSVIRAHISFLKIFPQTLQHRRKSSYGADKELRPFSIFWLYFIKNIRRYSEIAGNLSQTHLTKYTRLVDPLIANRKTFRYKFVKYYLPAFVVFILLLFIVYEFKK